MTEETFERVGFDVHQNHFSLAQEFFGTATSPPTNSKTQKRNIFRRVFGEVPNTNFKVLRNGMWLAFHTNNVEDKDQEILKSKAHKAYVRRVKAGLVDMPELWRSHLDGTRHGKALHVDYVETDGVLTVFAIGEFDQTPEGREAQKFYSKAKPGEVSLSHGFLFPKSAKKRGEYEAYNTFEISTLLRGQEANDLTNFVTKGKDMPLTVEQVADIEKVFGDSTTEIIKRVEERSKADKAAADLGAKYKNYSNFDDPQDEPEDTDETEVEGSPEGTPDSEGDATGIENTETIKAFKALIPALFEDSKLQLDLLQAMDKRIDAEASQVSAKNAALETRVKKLEALLEIKPVAASESPLTVINNIDPEKMSPEERATLSNALAAISAKSAGNGKPETVEDFVFGRK